MTTMFVLSSLYSESLESLSYLEEGLFRMEKFGNTDKRILQRKKRVVDIF